RRAPHKLSLNAHLEWPSRTDSMKSPGAGPALRRPLLLPARPPTILLVESFQEGRYRVSRKRDELVRATFTRRKIPGSGAAPLGPLLPRTDGPAASFLHVVAPSSRS